MNPELFVGIKGDFLKPQEPRVARAARPADPVEAPAETRSEPEKPVQESAPVANEESAGKMDVEGAVEGAEGADDAGNKRKREETGADENNKDKGEFKKLTLRARHQLKHRPNKEDRLCPATLRNEKCPFGEGCYYNHDIADYLSRKPADIGPRCYLYDTYGMCPQGMMCRFGDCHIDRVTLTSKTRPEADGGVLPRPPELNPLKKETQVLLRKKNAYFDYWKKQMKKASAAASTTDAQQSATAAADEASSAPAADESAVAATEASGEAKDSAVSPAEEGKDSAAPVVESSVVSNLRAAVPTAFTATYAADATADINDPVQRILHHNPYYNLTPYADKPVKLVDFTNKVYIAPLTTVGNLPFRRIMKDYGADITCGEMSMAFNLQCGQPSEWALLRRHVQEDVFGIQVAGNASDMMTRCAQLLERETVSEFVDLNCGCPIDVVCNRGAGSSLMNKPQKLIDILQSMAVNLPSRSLTVKVRTGWDEKTPTTHKLIPQLQQAQLRRGDDSALLSSRLACVFIHGRSRLQRYSKLANWDYIAQCARAQDPNAGRLLPIIGNGDLFSYHDWVSHRNQMAQSLDNLGALANVGLPSSSSLGPDGTTIADAVGDYAAEWAGESNNSTLMGLTSCAMLGRGALIKPWLPKEIKELRDYDISASERMEMLQRFCNYGLDHWGSDAQGVQTTRRFLLEWLSFLHRYVPQGITERPQRMNQRPPPYVGRGEIETLLASPAAEDWMKISEYFLGPVPEDYQFQPKHKSNAYASETNVDTSTLLSGAKDLEMSNG